MTVERVVRADWLLPISSAPLRDGFLAIDRGRIVAVGTGAHPPCAELVETEKTALLPAFVNAHSHLGCSFLRGANDGAQFLDWLTGSVAPRVIHAVENERELMERSARAAAEEMRAAGIGTVADSFFDDFAVAIQGELGLRALFFRELFGAREDDLEAYMERVEKRVLDDQDRFRGPLSGYGLAPHAPYTVPYDVLVKSVRIARERGLKLSLHLAESREEEAFFARAEGAMMPIFATAERRDRYRFGRSPVRMLTENGLLGPESILVHAVQVDADDVAALAPTGASIVHCPSSNAALGVGVAPIEAYLAAGINVALGTDSLASTGKLDFFEEMRLAIALQRTRPDATGRLDAARALEMATLGGARALGLEAEIGTLEPGKAADFMLVDLARARRDEIADPVSALVHSSLASDLRALHVAGRMIAGPSS